METISLAAEVIGRRLSEIRNERNLTIQRMAVNADIDPKHLKKNGKRNIRTFSTCT
ncbi:hypothetical protein [Longibaculum muris]|uniref:hypothetical protein n=1 Tax=Longibaculum muris TaxID=1796628 RepID=UPI00189C744B|nr:hypothetical protein [Longibaculum muris]